MYRNTCAHVYKYICNTVVYPTHVLQVYTLHMYYTCIEIHVRICRNTYVMKVYLLPMHYMFITCVIHMYLPLM